MSYLHWERCYIPPKKRASDGHQNQNGCRYLDWRGAGILCRVHQEEVHRAIAAASPRVRSVHLPAPGLDIAERQGHADSYGSRRAGDRRRDLLLPGRDDYTDDYAHRAAVDRSPPAVVRYHVRAHRYRGRDHRIYYD